MGVSTSRSTASYPAATATDIAREAGVSQSAVSLVMSGKEAGRVAARTATRIRSVAQRLSYQPNAAARALRSGTSSLLGLAVLDASHPFYGLVLSAADDAARHAGLSLSMIRTRGDEEFWEQRLADGLSSGYLAGGIIFGERLSTVSPLRALADRLVFVEVPEPGLRSIVLDTETAMAAVVTHLADLGHREIGYFAADYPTAVFARRVKHCADAAHQQHVRFRVEPSWRATFDVGTATAAARQLLNSGVGAVVCDDDLLALALHRCAAEQGRRVPGDLSIVGFGDLDMARLVHPQLTTVRLPADEIARVAVQVLISSSALQVPPIGLAIGTPLVVRGSTGPPTRLGRYGKALLQRLPRNHDAGIDLGAVDMSHLRIVKTASTDASLGTGAGEQVLPGFTGGGRGSQSVPELALIEQVIAAINERLGGNLTDADKVWIQQTFEYAAEDPHIRQAATANTQDNFGYVFDKKFEGLVLDRHDANADLINRVFKDTETTAFFTQMARTIVYELARQSGQAT